MNKQEKLVLPEKSFKELFLEFKDIIKYLKGKSKKVFFVAFIVGSVMHPDVCLFLKVQLIILHSRSKSASRVLPEMWG
jgi:hypothetical protein